MSAFCTKSSHEPGGTALCSFQPDTPKTEEMNEICNTTFYIKNAFCLTVKKESSEKIHGAGH